MGYFIKNRRLQSGSTSIVVPVGTSADRPDTPVYGTFRFNKSIGRLEYFNGTAFKSLSISGDEDIVVDTFIGDGVTTTFGPMSSAPISADQIIVFVGSIYQNPSTYQVFSYDITFTSAIPKTEVINIIHNLGSTSQ